MSGIHNAAGPVVQTTTLTGTANDFALVPGATSLRCTNATLLSLSGFAAGVDGQRVAIVAAGAGQVDLLHQSLLSVAASRLINFATSGPTSLLGGWAIIEYDATAGRWRLVAHEQGAWITTPFNAAHFTANTGAWTVDAGDRTYMKYRLAGRTLQIAIEVLSSSITGTPGLLSIANGQWGGFVALGSTSAPEVANGGRFIAQATAILIQNPGAAVWPATTNGTHVFGSIFCEVS